MNQGSWQLRTECGYGRCVWENGGVCSKGEGGLRNARYAGNDGYVRFS